MENKRIVKSVKCLSEEPWKNNSGELFWNFGVRFEDGGLAMASSKSASTEAPFWKAEGASVICTETGKKTAKGNPWVRFDKPFDGEEFTTEKSGNSTTFTAVNRIVANEQNKQLRIGGGGIAHDAAAIMAAVIKTEGVMPWDTFEKDYRAIFTVVRDTIDAHVAGELVSEIVEEAIEI
tara:strand:- start:4604 stop:5137 length:534 start_codon:yes stop_codon:yes gene_type:complete